MSKYTWIILAAIVAVGGYTYYSNQQAEEAARIEAEAVAAQVAVDAKAAEEAAAAKAAEEAAAAKAAEDAAAKAAEEAAAAAAKEAEDAAAAAAKAAEDAAAKAAEKAAAAAKAAEEAAAKAAEDAAAAAAKAAEDAAAAAAKAAEDAAAAAAKAAKDAAAKAAEEAAAKAAEEAAAATASTTSEAETMAFGSDADAGYAQAIWNAMLEQKLAGEDMQRAEPYEGTDPHGMMLELFVSEAVVQGHKGELIVKRNFGPVGVTAEQVLNNPGEHLAAITVMFRREAGYDEDTNNWFWAKFKPDGSIEANPAGVALAGKVAKGMDTGCITCHSAADGDDFVFADGDF